MAEISRTARFAGISRLYHYERFKPEYLRTTLKEHRIYCSNTTDLNDPWDCRPWFAVEDQNEIEEFIRWFLSVTPSAPFSDAEVEATKQRIRIDPAYRSELVQQISASFANIIPERWKIYCLTPVPDSTLMWSHYADDHRGVCLEFGTDNPIIGIALCVDYRRSYPDWAPHIVANAGAANTLLTKSDDWSYEKEYRIIALSQGISRPAAAAGLTLDGNFLGIPEGAIKSVIVGCEAPFYEVRKTILDLSPSMQIKRAVRSPNEFRLQIVDCH